MKMDTPLDNVSHRSRSSGGGGGSSNGNRTPDRRSTCSVRNANADNIQRAHQGRRSSLSNHSAKPADSPLKTGDGSRKNSSVSPVSDEADTQITDQNGNESQEAGGLRPRQRHVVKKQMRQVVGDLETVIGELRTVMGDLKTLVNQIDVVTERLDRQYPEEGDIKRRLSASVLESGGGKLQTPGAQVMRHSMSHSHDIQRISTPPLLSSSPHLTPTLRDKRAGSRTGLPNHVINDSTPSRVKGKDSSGESEKRRSRGETTASVKTASNPPSSAKTNSSGEKARESGSKKSNSRASKASKSSSGSSANKSNRHSVPSTTRDYELEGDGPLRIVEELASPLDAKTILDNLPRRDVLIPSSFFAAIENSICTRVVKNKSRSSTRSKGHKKTLSDTCTPRVKSDCHMFWSDTFSDSWFETVDRSSVKSRCSSGRTTQPRCSPHSDSPEVEYCGVYERELDEKLELEFDDHLEVFDTFGKDIDTPYKSKYDKNINTWKRYTMDYSSRDTSLDFSDDRLSDSISSSDILNDNFLPRTVNPTIVNYSWRTVIEP